MEINLPLFGEDLEGNDPRFKYLDIGILVPPEEVLSFFLSLSQKFFFKKQIKTNKQKKNRHGTRMNWRCVL